jgi:hypothetical protein
VPLAPGEAVAGGICRNFISRDLLEASNRLDALKVLLGYNWGMRAMGYSFPLINAVSMCSGYAC